jgi:hypothetical protein
MGLRVSVGSGLLASIAQSSHMLAVHREQARADADQHPDQRDRVLRVERVAFSLFPDCVVVDREW